MISRVLVANRGEIARRVFATCRRLGIGTVAVYTDPDAASPHVAEADARVRLEGTRGYLDAAQLIAAARAAGADAIHPGYGFLSENAEFASAVADAGLTWIGPPVAAVAAMGSKIEAKKMMAAAGVPVLEELDPDTVTAEAVAGIDQGIGGRRRPRHAGGRRIIRAARASGGRTPRSAVGLRRSDGVLRALPGHRPSRGGPGDGGPTRHRVGRRRTRMLDPAAPPEDHRRGSLAAGRPDRRACAPSFSMPRGWRRRPSATPVRAPSSSWPTRPATSSSSR